ncbi:MAG: alpha/beta hydrolase [Desulfobacteraceae bacterium]|nr:MAG: alpha/beta hydrolase [Desulfobacteraceae bacterium]
MTKLMKCILIAVLALVLFVGVLYYWFPGLILESVKHSLRFWAGLERREVQVNDHHWVYLEGGEGETILLVHGFGTYKDLWGTFSTAFSGSYRLIVPDLPGFGENSRIASDKFDIPSQVKRLSHFIETIGLDSFHMAGVSMGGYISAYYADKNPEKVKSLLLMDAAGVDSRIPSNLWRRYQKEGTVPLLYKTPEQFDELMRVLFHKPPWVPGRFKDYIAREGALNYDFHEKILREMVDGGMNLLESRLATIRAKTLIIWGANDQILHVSSVEKFQAGLRNSRIVILDQCGHVPYLEKPKETKRAYKDFLASLD